MNRIRRTPSFFIGKNSKKITRCTPISPPLSVCYTRALVKGGNMPQKGTVLVVDNEPDILEVLGKELSNNGYDVRLAQGGLEGLETAKKIFPDLLILDINMPDMDGLQLKATLNLDEATAEIPTIFLSASTETVRKVETFGMGADDYVTKPFNLEELMARVDSILLRHKRSIELAMTDKLTGLYNLHVYKKQVMSLFNGAKRYGRNLSLAILDVDNLKATNDSLGHRSGDFVIRKVAEVMKRVFRRPDILIRYGGDEFVVLFPESSNEQAVNAIRRFREELEGRLYTTEEPDQNVSISVSCGLASYDETTQNVDALFKAADKNLYQEKSAKKSS